MRVPVHSIYNTLYCGWVTMGEEMYFRVFFDTSSSDFWLPSTDCDWSSKWCRSRGRYNHLESDTYEDAHKNFTTSFGGALVKGRVSIDSVTLGDMGLIQQQFGEAISLPDDFISIPFTKQPMWDGVIGLGFSKEASTGSPILLNKAFPNKLFSFSLFKSAESAMEVIGELVIGEIDDERYTGELVWSHVTSDTAWEVKMDAISIGNVNLCEGECRVIANTSMAAIVGPKAQVELLFDQLNAREMGGLVIRAVDCDQIPNFPDLEFVIEGQTVRISPYDYISEQSFEGLSVEVCFLKILTLEDDIDDKWVLGAMAHKPLYIVYDLDNARIGFAESVGY